MMSARQYLEMMTKMQASVLRPGIRYPSFEDLLLGEGREWTPADLPPDVRPMKMKECFRNAFVLAESRPDLTYVEGFASCIIPCHHAWTVDQEGRVVDPTWLPRKGSDWEGRSYFGVPFDLDYLRRVQLETEVFGVFFTSIPTLTRDPAEYVAPGWRVAA